MSEANPMKPQFDMNKYRKAMRATWKAMQRSYVSADSNFVRDRDGTLRFRKAEFPQIADFEIRVSRRREEDR